jgi:hypothetical protein
MACPTPESDGAVLSKRLGISKQLFYDLPTFESEVAVPWKRRLM